CARVALLHEGRLLALDTPQRLQAPLAGQLLEVTAAGPRPPVEILARVPGVNNVQTFGDRAHVRIDPGARAQVIAAIEAVMCGVQGAAPRRQCPGRQRAADCRLARGRLHRIDYRKPPMRYVFFAVAIAIATGAAAQPQAPPLTLDEAIAQGIANSQRLAELQARGEGAEFAIAGRHAADMPAIALLGGHPP